MQIFCFTRDPCQKHVFKSLTLAKTQNKRDYLFYFKIVHFKAYFCLRTLFNSNIILKNTVLFFCRFKKVNSVGFRVAPKRYWWEKMPQKKVLAFWFNKFWEDPWTRGSRCPTGRGGRCASAKLDMQVSRYACRRTMTESQMVAVLLSKEYQIILLSPDGMQTRQVHTPLPPSFSSILTFPLVTDAYCLLDVYSVLSGNPARFGLPADLSSVSSSKPQTNSDKKQKEKQKKKTKEGFDQKVSSH